MGETTEEDLSRRFYSHCLWLSLRPSPRVCRTALAGRIENHEAAVALNYFVYNFIKIHRTLKVTPAMAAGVTSKLWEVSDLVALLVESESQKAA